MNASQIILSLVLATMVFSVALELRIEDFKRVAQAPQSGDLRLDSTIHFVTRRHLGSHPGARPAPQHRSRHDFGRRLSWR